MNFLTKDTESTEKRWGYFLFLDPYAYKTVYILTSYMVYCSKSLWFVATLFVQKNDEDFICFSMLHLSLITDFDWGEE